MHNIIDTGLIWPVARTVRKYTDHIQIHHTVGDYSTIEKWRALHLRRIRVNRHKGIGYSFGITEKGEIFEGRGLIYEHGAVKNSLTKDINGVGAADRSVSIALIGDMRRAGMPTNSQLEACLALVRDVMIRYSLKKEAVLGHREVRLSSGGTYPTLCPGFDMVSFRAKLDNPDTLPEETHPVLYYYTGDTYVHLRSGPGTEYLVIGRLKKGEECLVLSMGDTWAEVVLHNLAPALRGFCINKYLSRV